MQPRREVSNTSQTHLFLGRPKSAGGISSAPPTGKPGELGAGHAKSARKPIKLRDSNSFQTYIFRVLKEVKPELSVSKKSMSLLNNIAVELFEKIMKESRELMIHSKKHTLTSKEIESAIKLHFPGELQKLALATCRGSLKKFQENNNA